MSNNINKYIEAQNQDLGNRSSAPEQPPPYTQVQPGNAYPNNAPISTNAYHLSSNPNPLASKEDRFREIINRHEISQFFANKLQVLNTFKVVFVFDDSGSMNTIIEDSPLNNGLFKATRWDELRYLSKISLEIANIFNDNGTDIYFLNRPPLKNITHVDQMNEVFQLKPSGYTPLARILRYVLMENSNIFLNENKLLIVVVTDGEPTDG